MPIHCCQAELGRWVLPVSKGTAPTQVSLPHHVQDVGDAGGLDREAADHEPVLHVTIRQAVVVGQVGGIGDGDGGGAPLVGVVVLVLGDEYPRLQREFDPLLRSALIFFVMTLISAASFYSLAKNHRLRYWAQASMWLGLLGIGLYYWP